MNELDMLKTRLLNVELELSDLRRKIDEPIEATGPDKAGIAPGPTVIETWQKDGLTYYELARQPYSDCLFAGGVVKGHSVDTVYLRCERDNGMGSMIMLRPDELAAIGWIANSVLWSVLLRDVNR